MKRYLHILVIALLLTACSNRADPRAHLIDEDEVPDTLTQSENDVTVSDNILPTTVFYTDDVHKPQTYDYIYMMYPLSGNVPAVGVHKKVSVSYNTYTVLEDDEAILTSEGDLNLIPTGNVVPQEIEVKNRTVVNQTLGYEKFYSELSLSEALMFINNLDVGVSENGINGTLFIPDNEYSNRPYSVEIQRRDNGEPDIIRVIGFGVGVTNDDTNFTDFATYDFE